MVDVYPVRRERQEHNMARLESQAVSGYFATPSRVVDMVASKLKPESFTGSRWSYPAVTIIDPCAGEGHAIKSLQAHVENQISENCKGWVFTRAIELEGDRAKQCAELFGVELSKERKMYDTSVVVNANALLCSISSHRSKGLGICWLNPPYDHDRLYRRTEEAFLRHVTRWLNPYSLLFFVVPYYALIASVRTLAMHYESVQCYKFPNPEYDLFKQVIVVARRTMTRVIPDWFISRNVERWATEPDTIPNIESMEVIEYQVDNNNEWITNFDIRKINEADVMLQHVPFHFTGKKGSAIAGRNTYPQKNIDSLLQQSYPLAASPKPAHVATAVAAGVFNGARIMPNTKGLPPLLVKGVFDKEFRTIKENADKSGTVTSLVQVQQPKLTVTVFDLENKVLRQLPQGVIVNEKLSSVSEMTVADLLYYYSRDMLRVMLEQCPVNYTPADASQYILPRTRRRLYTAQSHTVRALVKLFSDQSKETKATSAILLGEIGCGKSTVSLVVAKMLKAERVIVMCPPHLLQSWQNQYTEVFGRNNTKVLQSIQDIEEFSSMNGFALGILSREAAKLDHEKGSVSNICPSCGLPIERKDYARKREKCSNTVMLSQVGSDPHPWADSVVKLARCLNAAYSNDETIKMLLPQGVYRKRSSVDKYTVDENKTMIENHVRGLPALERLMVQMIESIQQVNNDIRELFIVNTLKLIAAVCDDFVDVLNRVNRIEKAMNKYESKQWVFSIVDLCNKACELKGVVVPEHLKSIEPECSLTLNNNIFVYRRQRSSEALLDVLKFLVSFCGLTRVKECGEPLYYSTPKPRRIALSTYIAKHAKHCFDFLILDEGHEYSADGSAQEKAAHRLVQLGKPTLLMTGSIMNGYAHSLFANLWYMSQRFRSEFEREDVERFVDRYGYRKQVVELGDGKKKSVEYGIQSDRVVTSARKVGVAPGVLPLLVIKHLLPIAVTLHKEDLQLDLPPSTQETIRVAMLPEQREAYERLLTALKAQISSDMFTERNGKLWGQMSELPSFLDRCVPDAGNTTGGEYVIRYPENMGGDIVASEPPMNRSLLPKEQWLIERVKAELCEGRKVIVYGYHVELLPRLKRVIEENIGEPVALLESRKVPPHERESWIETNVLKPGKRVLVLNPVGVKTGINNLVSFSTAIWFENPACNPEIMRQANGRIDRIGQTQPTRMLIPIYTGSLQEQLQSLLMAKVAVSLQTDGLSGESALEAAGASSEDVLNIGFDNIGKMLFELLQRDSAA